MSRPPFDRAQMQARVIVRVEGGYTARALETLAGYPSRRTVARWAKADPAFALQLSRARAWGRGLRGEARLARAAFDAARAEAFLLRVRRGEAVRALVRTPGQPNRDVLTEWKRLRPDFAAALEEAARFSAEVRAPAWRTFDEAVADAIVLRVSRGEPLRAVEADPAMPGRATVDRWRRRHADFDAALRLAALSGQRRRMRGRRTCTPALTEAICAHLRGGGSLRSAARLAGAPHRVTLYGWLRSEPAFARAVAWARGERDARMMDQALDIAEATTAATVAADALRLAAIRRRLGQLGGGRPRRGSALP